MNDAKATHRIGVQRRRARYSTGHSERFREICARDSFLRAEFALGSSQRRETSGRFGCDSISDAFHHWLQFEILSRRQIAIFKISKRRRNESIAGPLISIALSALDAKRVHFWSSKEERYRLWPQCKNIRCFYSC